MVVVPKEGYGALYLEMANKASVDIQQYYPGIRVHCILYNHDIPATIRPAKNVVVFYCGQGCNNHYINSGECTHDSTVRSFRYRVKRKTISSRQKALRPGGEMCRESGATRCGTGYYGVTFNYYMVSLPCIYNIYYDYKYLYEECNVRGIYYEGRLPQRQLRGLKAYMSVKMESEHRYEF